MALDRAELATASNQTPTFRLLPPGVRGGQTPRLGEADLERARRLVGARHLMVRMAVQAGDEQGGRLADLVRAELAPLGIDVRPRIVADVSAALRDPDEDLHLAALTTSLDYPDPASFLSRMFGHDVPDRWLSTSTQAAVDRLDRLTGAARDRAAAALAASLSTSDVPVVAFGTRELGVVLGSRVGCRVWNGVDAGLDLAALCVTGS